MSELTALEYIQRRFRILNKSKQWMCKLCITMYATVFTVKSTLFTIYCIHCTWTLCTMSILYICKLCILFTVHIYTAPVLYIQYTLCKLCILFTVYTVTALYVQCQYYTYVNHVYYLLYIYIYTAPTFTLCKI